MTTRGLSLLSTPWALPLSTPWALPSDHPVGRLFEQVVAGLNTVMESFISGTSAVPQIASHVMHMLALPEVVLQTLDVEAAALKAARVKLNEMLETSMVRPKQLLALYEEFDELVGIDVAKHLEETKSAGCTLEKYAEMIEPTDPHPP